MNTSTKLLPAPNWYNLSMALYKENYPLIGDVGLVKDVGVFELRKGSFHRVDKAQLCGIQTLIPKAFMLRVWTRDVSCKEMLVEDLRKAELNVQKRYSFLRMMPSHPGWVRRTVRGRTYCDVLFGAVEIGERNLANSRLTRLIGHVDERSRYLGERKFFVARGDHSMKDWDGHCLLNPERFTVPWQALKVYGTTKFGTDYIKEGSPTVKCCGEFNRKLWKKACKEHGISDDFDGIIPEVSLKFDDNSDVITVELFSVFDSIMGEHFTVSLQMLMNTPITDEAHDWAAEKFIRKFEVREDALRDSSGLKAVALLDRDVLELKLLLADGSANAESAEIERDISEGIEAMSSLITRIVAGLPVDTSKYLKGILPVLMRAMRNFHIVGCSEMVVPDSKLKPYEVAISRREWRHFKRNGVLLKVGDDLLVARHPNTGTEVATCRLAYIGRSAINPLWWAERFSGDFDGDPMSVGTLALESINVLVDEDGFAAPPKSGKVKTKVAQTVSEANASGFWSQAMIPTIDTYLRICNEKGIDAGQMKNLLQWVIDSAKNQIDFDIDEIIAEVGLKPKDRMSSLGTLMSARLGGSKTDKLLVYNGLVRRAKHELTHVKWMNKVRVSGCLFYVIAGDGDPAYATLLNKVDSRKANGYEKFLTYEMQRVFREIGAKHLLSSENNYEKQVTIDVDKLDPAKVKLLKSRAIALPKEAKTLAHAILNKYRQFISELNKGLDSTTKAFGNIRDAVDMILVSDYGDSALKYLFASLVFRIDPGITMRATTVLGYLPLVHGTYNIAKIIEYLGYERKFNVHVLKEGETVE